MNGEVKKSYSRFITWTSPNNNNNAKLTAFTFYLCSPFAFFTKFLFCLKFVILTKYVMYFNLGFRATKTIYIYY